MKKRLIQILFDYDSNNQLVLLLDLFAVKTFIFKMLVW